MRPNSMILRAGTLATTMCVVGLSTITSGSIAACSRSARSPRPETVRVAAIQYADVGADEVEDDCKPQDADCALEALVRRAAHKGAVLIVLPEYGLNQTEPEAIAEKQGTTPDPSRAPIAARFSRLARDLRVFLVVNLLTKARGAQRNSQLVFDQQGRVLAWHHKFELFAHEKSRLESGDSVTVFDTPFGRVGLLICADLYGAPRKHRRLTRELGADLVAVSTYWTASNARRWPAAFARDWGVHVVAANAGGGKSAGSGVFAPTGQALASSGAAPWGVVVADIPVRREAR